MKNTRLFLFTVLLLSLSSCIKVQDEAIDCKSLAPPTPVTTNSNYTVTAGENLLVYVSNYDYYTLYTVTAPNGTKYSSSDNYPIRVYVPTTSSDGVYTINAAKPGLSCASSNANFNVSVSAAVLPSCGINPNSVIVDNYTWYNITAANSYFNSSYTSANWNISGSGRTLQIYFKGQPATNGQVTAFEVSSNYANSLTDGQCRVEFEDYGDVYYGTSGTVYTQYTNGYMRVVFCSVNIYNYYYGTDVIKGSLLYN